MERVREQRANILIGFKSHFYRPQQNLRKVMFVGVLSVIQSGKGGRVYLWYQVPSGGGYSGGEYSTPRHGSCPGVVGTHPQLLTSSGGHQTCTVDKRVVRILLESFLVL